MFNVLIAFSPTAWETDQLMRMRLERFLKFSGSEAKTISAKQPNTLKTLEGIDTLLIYELQSESVNAEVVRFGNLHNIKVDGQEIVFQFNEEGTFPRSVMEEFAELLGMDRFQRSHTHWSVKDLAIPKAIRSKVMPSYDVVFSFAGEDRKYVAKVATYLRAKGIRVFYDEYEQVQLWGKDLAEHLDLVYHRSGQFCVIFISKDYVKKMWTKPERRAAFSRAMKQQGEYILPARFDDTNVPGIPDTMAWITLSGKTPAKFGKFILGKLGKHS